jgi:hypothetical protein
MPAGESALLNGRAVFFYLPKPAYIKDDLICLKIIGIIVGGVKKSSYFWSVKYK